MVHLFIYNPARSTEDLAEAMGVSAERVEKIRGIMNRQPGKRVSSRKRPTAKKSAARKVSTNSPRRSGRR